MTAGATVAGGPGTTVDGAAPGQVCLGCGARPDLAEGIRLRCPAARPGDDVDHVLVASVPTPAVAPGSAATQAGDPDEPNPYVRWRQRFLAHRRWTAAGRADADYVALVRDRDDAVAAVDGHGFAVTPFSRSDGISAALGFARDGGVWVKDDTGNVSGSHKARHLFGTLVALDVDAALGGTVVSRDAPLAIASCGNAALAAAVVARAARRPLDVFIPPDADPVVVSRLERLGASCTVCERRPGEHGDPTVHALLSAVDGGAVPFTCQGGLNGLALEGGETLGFELAAAVGGPAGPPRLDRLVVQVGGGALLTSVVLGLRAAGAALPRTYAVQPVGVHPLARACGRVRLRVDAGEPLADALDHAARHRSVFMWPWEAEPHSVAHGIIDDETYDWRTCVEAVLASGGAPLVVAESTLREANALAQDAGYDVDHTGSAGLAGLVDLVRTGAVDPHENVAVLLTGAVRRDTPTHATSGGQ